VLSGSVFPALTTKHCILYSIFRLILRENNIESLSTKAFANFDAINYTSLEGNPMRNIDAEAFRDAKIKVTF
jgi:hypothetical protein